MWLYSLVGVEWGLHFPAANGEYQSPINLNSREAQYDPSLLDVRLSPNYVVCRDCEVINDGHTVRIILKSKSGDSQETCHFTFLNINSNLLFMLSSENMNVWINVLTIQNWPYFKTFCFLVVFPSYLGSPVLPSVVSGGPLPSDHEYELHEVRFHWGKENQRGSEHTVNFKAFPMEVVWSHIHVYKAGAFYWGSLSAEIKTFMNSEELFRHFPCHVSPLSPQTRNQMHLVEHGRLWLGCFRHNRHKIVNVRKSKSDSGLLYYTEYQYDCDTFGKWLVPSCLQSCESHADFFIHTTASLSCDIALYISYTNAINLWIIKTTADSFLFRNRTNKQFCNRTWQFDCCKELITIATNSSRDS